MNFKNWLEGIIGSEEVNDDDYRGLHRAPDRTSGSPLHDVTLETYPDDFYTPMATRYYGDGYPFDTSTVNLIQSLRNKPNAPVKIYRAVPKTITIPEKIHELEKQKAYILKFGRLPKNVKYSLDSSKYYEIISSELNKLKQQPIVQQEKAEINPGDWVTISRPYAIGHGTSSLLGSYRILTKTVKAKDLFTDGNSIHEWGYDPS